MNTKRCWLGYLDAGIKSGYVLHDPDLDTGNNSTMYLFNLTRQSILEYHRATVEPKLRALRSEESEQARELEAAFKRARKAFAPRRQDVSARPERPQPERRKAAAPAEDEDFGLDMDLELAAEDE